MKQDIKVIDANQQIMEQIQEASRNVSDQDTIQALDHMYRHYKTKADDLEEKLLISQAESIRHANARVRAETALNLLQQQVEQKSKEKK